LAIQVHGFFFGHTIAHLAGIPSTLPILLLQGTGRVDRVPSDCRKQSFEDFG